MARNYKKRNEDEEIETYGLDDFMLKKINEYLFNEIDETIEEYFLESWDTFNNEFYKLKPTKKEYEYLKENDNWALYDSYYDYPKTYLNEVYKIASETIDEDNPESWIDFVESSEFQDASSNIAHYILETGLKGIKKEGI